MDTLKKWYKHASRRTEEEDRHFTYEDMARSFQVKRKGEYPSRVSSKRGKFSRRRFRRRRSVGVRSGINVYNPTKVDYAARRPRSGRVVRRARRFTRAVEKVEMRAMPKHYVIADIKSTGAGISRPFCGQVYPSDSQAQAYFPGQSRSINTTGFFSLNTIDDMQRISSALFGGPTGSSPYSRNQERIYVTSSKMVVDFRWIQGWNAASGNGAPKYGGYIELYHLRARHANAFMDFNVILNGFSSPADPAQPALVASMNSSVFGVDLFKNRQVTTQWKILSKRSIYLQSPEADNDGTDAGATSGVQTIEFKGKPFSFSYYDLSNAAAFPFKTEIIVGCYYGEPSVDNQSLIGYADLVQGRPVPFSFVFSATKEYIIKSMMPAVGADSTGGKLPIADSNSVITMNA